MFCESLFFRIGGIYFTMKVLRLIALSALTFAIPFTVFYGGGKIADNGVPVSPAEYKGILTLWHIDTFEGGVGSRKQFLLSVSRDFEKRNAGVLVMAMDRTAESAKAAIAEGKFPDLISFGAGVDVGNLRPLDLSVKSYGGGYNGVTYAVPWARGGYCLIENPDFTANKKDALPIIVSQGENTNPLVAYALSGRTGTDFEILTPVNAYLKFTSGKAKYLVGTQRDINRLIARGTDFVSVPLAGYNDLYQYIAVATNDETKAPYCAEFINFMISESVQKKLHTIGMYGCYYRAEYDSPDMSAMQETENGYCISAFSSAKLIKDLQEKGKAAAAGNENELAKIKKLIVSP